MTCLKDVIDDLAFTALLDLGVIDADGNLLCCNILEGDTEDDPCCDLVMSYASPCCLYDGILSNPRNTPPGAVLNTIAITWDLAPAANVIYNVVDCVGTPVAGPFTHAAGQTISTNTLNPPLPAGCYRIGIISGLGPEGNPNCRKATVELLGSEAP